MTDNDDDRGEERPSRRPRGVQFRLVVTRSDGTVVPIDVGASPVAIGRAEESDIQIDEARVSRHHCVIFSRAGRLNVQDQGSANGTYVNGEWVTHAPLSHGDEILVGSTKIRVEVTGLAGLYGVALRRAASSTPPPASKEPAPLATGPAWPPKSPAVVRRLGALLASSDDPSSAQDAALALALEALPIDRAFLMVADEPGADPRVVATKQRGGEATPRSRPSINVARRAYESGEPFHCMDVASDERLAANPEVRASDVASLFVTPLVHEGATLGVLYVDGGVLGAFTREALPVLAGVAKETALALGRARTTAEVADESSRVVKERDELDRLVRTLEREVQHRTAQTEDQRLELALKVTELEHLREARQSLAQGLVQDIRSMVASAEARIDMVRGSLSEGRRSPLAEATLELRRIVALADDIQAIVQMEDGEFGLSTAPVKAEALVKGALTRNADAARLLDVALSGAAAQPDAEAIGDERVLGRVIDNLVAMALQAAGRGGDVAVQATAAAGRVEVSVAESGTGTLAAERERSVERWLRSTSTSVRALGAAFHFCRLAVEAHGGALTRDGDRGSRRWVLSLPSRPDEGDEDTITH